jgi:hypothetical protein
MTNVKYCQKHNRKYLSDIGCQLCKANEARAKDKALPEIPVLQPITIQVRKLNLEPVMLRKQAD